MFARVRDVQRKVLKAGNQYSEIIGFERLTLLNIVFSIRFIYYYYVVNI